MSKIVEHPALAFRWLHRPRTERNDPRPPNAFYYVLQQCWQITEFDAEHNIKQIRDDWRDIPIVTEE